MTVTQKAKASAEEIQTFIENKREYQYRKFLRVSDNAYIRQIQPILAVAGKVEPQYWPVGAIPNTPIINLFSALYPEVGISFAKYANRSMRNVAGVWELKDKADDLVPVWREMIRQYIYTSVGNRISGITDTTRSGIQSVINYCITNGLSIEDSSKYLMSKVNSIGITRARLITRTEILTASNYGQYIGYKSLDIPLEKAWLTARDERVRNRHAAANGQKRGLDELFDVGGEKMLMPGDSSHGASTSNILRCRCVTYSEPV